MARDLSSPERPLLLAGVMIAALSVLVGCGDGETVVTATRTPTPTPVSQEEAVKHAYAAALENGKRALLGPADQVRVVLRESHTGEELDQLVRDVIKTQEEHRAPTGRLVPHVGKVELRGTEAIVYDCLDLGSYGFKDTRTGEQLPRRGPVRAGYKVWMRQGGDGRWRISRLRGHEESCS
ncbi:hypothetical protein SAMN04489712_110239 [Thermomonospora echinospora]|uniref:DUF4440 domain-containing protein n=1 Tax=Thermomonospora echinospora TaxID=1992 RepID=A0A1H6CNE1_9ACTN|nr:hypothetical protein [Thermomonospora echinospora]SEG74539.1 hypothetical protein SAMN04489712_110239 [Thermomonospora echinospora]